MSPVQFNLPKLDFYCRLARQSAAVPLMYAIALSQTISATLRRFRRLCDDFGDFAPQYAAQHVIRLEVDSSVAPRNTSLIGSLRKCLPRQNRLHIADGQSIT
jgi:hypothetical protein